MCDLSNICFMCLKDINKLQTEDLYRTEDAVKQMKYVLPEITLEPELPVQICSTCHTKLHSFCTFKKQCLENYCRFTEKLRESGNAKDQSLNAFQIEIKNIKEENQVDDDLTNEAPDELNSQINFIKEDTIKAVHDETISIGFNINISEVSDMTDNIKSFKYEEQHDQTNSFIEDIYIKENIIKFEDSEEQNLYEELLSDINKEIDSEQDVNEIESADLNINNLECTVSNLVISLDLNQTLNEESDIKEKIKSFEPKFSTNNFTQKSDVNSHIKIQSGIEDFSICEKKFKQPGFQCSICKKMLAHKRSLNDHMKTHTGEKDFQCSVCEKKFTHKSSLNIHIKTHTGEKDFQCSFCEKKFANKSSLNIHIKTHTGEKDFQCSFCEKKFTQKGNLDMHVKRHIGVKNFQCSICEKKFLRNNDMKGHMKTHIGVKGFKCSICDKKFAYKSSLNIHIKTHTGEKDFQCSFCEKKFTQKGNLDMHVKIHTGVKDFECSICGKKFLRNDDMKMHMKTHIGVKGFKCSICDKNFAHKGSLNIHMKTHTGEKDFQCSVCEKKFTRKGNLDMHVKIHTGVKEFQCSICGKNFLRYNDMKGHLTIHTGVKSFKCSICEKKFIQRKYLNKHMKIHTGVKDL